MQIQKIIEQLGFTNKEEVLVRVDESIETKHNAKNEEII